MMEYYEAIKNYLFRIFITYWSSYDIILNKVEYKIKSNKFSMLLKH